MSKASSGAAHALRVPSVRLVPENSVVLKNLGPLAELAGTWKGKGFNLIARPDKEQGANLFLELNQTRETLEFDPISSSIPNRGFLQVDIELFGLTYLQQITDATTGGALHIEPGIWVTVPATDQPSEPQSIARMATIPHGNAVLAPGTAVTVKPVPSPLNLSGGTFPSFNTAPFAVGGGVQPAGTLGGFPAYNLANPATPANPRTPLGDIPPVPLPPDIDGVPMQDLVKDPILVLQKTLTDQAATGHSIESMTVLNISTTTSVSFATVAGPGGATVQVPMPLSNGGVENLPFLVQNANAATVYATFWIEKIVHPTFPAFLQFQYAQMVFLNFPILNPPPVPPAKPVVLTWPHVSVATLRKAFG